MDAVRVDMEGSVCVVVDAAVVAGVASSQGRCAMADEVSMLMCGAPTGSVRGDDLSVPFSGASDCL